MTKRLLFWGSTAAIGYTYVGFPLLLFARGLLKRPFARNENIAADVSFIICAHNEAETIEAKLENVLALDYPKDKLQVLVASDGSDDGTNEIVRRYADKGVTLYDLPRNGKIPALNTVASQAQGEILVFSDANSMYKPDALRELLAPFSDPNVGAVGGNQVYIKDSSVNAASFGERMYWSFDRNLKIMQSRAGNITSATGAIHAIRRKLFRPVPLGVGDDFVISTRAISQNHRLVFAPDAVAMETLAATDEAEFKRKVRVIVRGLRGLWAVRDLFNPFRHGFYSLQIFSHKLMRWSVGWMMITSFASSISLYRQDKIYKQATLAQIGFYGSALTAFLLRDSKLAQSKLFKPLTIPFAFCMANYAAMKAWVQVLSGERVDIWDSNRNVGDADASTD